LFYKRPAEARKAIFHAQRAVLVARAAKDEFSGSLAIIYSPLIDLRIVSRLRQHRAEQPRRDEPYIIDFTV
jgi:hypothetical protein